MEVDGSHAKDKPEKLPLIEQPADSNDVKLSPGWEDTQKDRSKGVADLEEAAEDFSDPPRDRYWMVYLIMTLHGIGTLMPWNMFITANSYFSNYKLSPLVSCEYGAESSFKCCATATPPPSSFNSTATCRDREAEYRMNFLSYLGIVAQSTNVFLNGLNLFCRCGGKGSNEKRIVGSIIIVVACFIVTVVLAMVDSNEWPGGFFVATMITVVIINMANGVYQNCIYGEAAILPMRYTNAVVLGSNISGTITSLLIIISFALAPDVRTSAIYYFVGAIVVLLIALDTFFALPYISFFKFYKNKVKVESEREEAAKKKVLKSASDLGPGGEEGAAATEESSFSSAIPLPTFIKIFKQAWVQLLSVWFIFFVTLTCFPAIQAKIEPTTKEFPLKNPWFEMVGCFLFFNAAAMFGNLTTEFVKFPGPRFVWIPVLARVVFIPFFVFCNYYPDNRGTIPVLFGDVPYLICSLLMGFTSGYFSSLVMMYAPRKVESSLAGVAGMMAALFLILGIFSGVYFSLLVAKIMLYLGQDVFPLQNTTNLALTTIASTS